MNFLYGCYTHCYLHNRLPSSLRVSTQLSHEILQYRVTKRKDIDVYGNDAHENFKQQNTPQAT